jgi:hypothetical protein
MEKKEIELLRENCEIARGMKDEEIDKLDAYLKETPCLRRPDFLQVANLIELKDLRKSCYPAMPEPFAHPYGENLFWLFCCESLFVEGHYGPCCIWARAVVEFELQEFCLLDAIVPEGFKTQIRNRGKHRTPGLDECLEKLKLGNSLRPEDHKACAAVKDNGDYVVHHRLDRIMGQIPEDIFRQRGVPESEVNSLGLEDRRVLMKILRYDRERIRAKESMKNLYEFELRRPPIPL